jgi:hypothetical protein
MKKRHVIGLTCGVFIMTSGCLIVVGPIESVEEDFELADGFDGINGLRIDWRNGSITLRVDAEVDGMRAEGTKRVSAPDQATAEALIDDLQIVLGASSASDDELVLSFDAPPDMGRISYAANVEVVIPRGIAVIIDNNNGGVTVSGNEGTTGITVDNGGVTVEGQNGDTDIDVDNGSITIETDAGAIDARTENGGITIRARPGENDDIAAETRNGSISIRIPQDTGATVDLRTRLGSIAPIFGGFEVTGLTVALSRVTATLNGGGIDVRAETELGGIEFESLP